MKTKLLLHLIALSCLLLAASMLANTVTVTTLADNGPGSLRTALAATAGGGTINFQAGLTGTITLTNGELPIGRSVTILGPGATVLTVNGNHNSRVFNILSNTPMVAVTISGLTISGGWNLGSGPGSPPPPAQGGGILNSGSLTLSNCLVAANTATGGGAALQDGDGEGGGIYSSGTLTLLGCTVENNNASNSGQGFYGGNGHGGGIYLTGGSLVNCTIAGNTASGGNGNPISGGSGDGVGGGICVASTNVQIICCTISGNLSEGGGSSPLPGGGFGGGIYVSGTAAPTLENTIVSGNSVVGGQGLGNHTGTATGPDADGSVNSGGFNLIGQTDGSSGWVGSDLTGTVAVPFDPLLGPLQNNGGPTPTMAPALSSAVVDQGYSFGLTTDQRGAARPFVYPTTTLPPSGDGSDIGAVELPVPLHLSLQLTTLNLVQRVALFWNYDSPGAPTNPPAFGVGTVTNLHHGVLDEQWMAFAKKAVRIVGPDRHFMTSDDTVAGTGLYTLSTAITNLFIPPPLTGPASDLTATTATLNGSDIPAGNNTLYWFAYGTDSNYGSTTPTNSLNVSTSSTPVSVAINGLTPLGNYHFQLMVADDDWGTQYGGDQTFTTPGLPPVVVTQPASAIATTSAQLNGTVNGEGTPIAGHFQYWYLEQADGGNYWVTNQTTPEFYGPPSYAVQPFSAIVTYLRPSTVYYYQIVARNPVAQVFGAVTNFTTTP